MFLHASFFVWSRSYCSPFFERGSLVQSCVGIALVVFALSLVFGNRNESAKSKADSIIKLPPAAQVVGAELGDWAGDGKVVFKLPTSRPAEVWFEEVWEMNKSNKPNGAIENRPFPAPIRTETAGEDYRSLEYDPKSRLYHYEVILGL